MATSKKWLDLKREVETLRNQFLPSKFDPLGQYGEPDRVHAHTRAFLVLCHAEIEAYLEGWAKEIARAAEKTWTSSSRITTPFGFLLASLSERIGVPDTLSRKGTQDGPQRLSAVSVKLFQKYYKQINENNGIKETNVLRLFGPLGIPATALGTTLLPSLDAVGAMRGKYAHESAKAVSSVCTVMVIA